MDQKSDTDDEIPKNDGFHLLMNVVALGNRGFRFEDKDNMTYYYSMVECDPVPVFIFFMMEGRCPLGDPRMIVRWFFHYHPFRTSRRMLVQVGCDSLALVC